MTTRSSVSQCKTFVAVIVGMLALPTFATWYATTGGDFATLGTPWTAADNLQVKQGSYTLSDDFALLPNVWIYSSNSGGTWLFDFSANSKTMTVNKAWSMNANVSGGNVTYKGGAWAFGTLYLGTDGNSISHDTTTLLDDVTMGVSGDFCPLAAAQNDRVVLTNGTSVTLSGSTVVFFRATPNANVTETSSNNLFDVTAGCRVETTGTVQMTIGSYGQTSDQNMHGNVLRIAGDGARVNAYRFYVGSRGNGVVVGDGGLFTNRQSCVVGNGNYASHDYLHVLEGGVVQLGVDATYANLTVGGGGSAAFNEVVVSNGSLRARLVITGNHSSSHDNVLKIMGAKAEIVHLRNEGAVLFGAGYNNRVVLDDGAGLSYPSIDFTSADNGYGSYNRLELCGRSTLDCTANLTVGNTANATCGNRVFVGAGSTLNVGGNVGLYSDDAQFVISNGTANVNGRLYLTADLNSVCDHPGTNVTLVLQGESPTLTATDGGFFLGYGNRMSRVGIRFELPPQGYSVAPIRNVTQFQHGDDVRIEFSGLEECQRTIEQSMDMPLIHTTANSGLDWLTDGVLDRVNTALPKGCRIFKQKNEGADGYTLMLHVKRAGRGFVMLFR